MLLSGGSRSGPIDPLSRSQSAKAGNLASKKHKDKENVSFSTSHEPSAQDQAKGHSKSSTAGSHRYQSLSSVHNEERDAETSVSSSLTPSSQARPRTPTTAHATSRSHLKDVTRSESESPASARDGSFRAVYPYPDNEDVIVWKSKDPKTAMTTTISTLDTRANTDSNSIMSQTRRIMDQRRRQRQLDIQRDLSGHSDRSSLPPPPKTLNDEAKPGGIRKSSQRNSSAHISFQDSTSPTMSPTHRDHDSLSSTTAASRSNRSRDGTERGSSSRRQLQRVLSGPIFISNPRGIAPTPSPDASLELKRITSEKASSSKAVVTKDQQPKQMQERVRRYEAQLDHRIETIQANNRRLLELKLLLENRDRALVIHQGGDAYDSYDDDSEEEWMLEQEQQRTRAQLEEAKTLLEQSEHLQQELRDDLEREQATNKEMNTRIQELSDRLKEALELGDAQTLELKQVRQKAVRDVEQVRQQATMDLEQVERRLSEGKTKQNELQLALKSKEERLEETARQRSTHQAETRKLNTDVTSLNNRIQELEAQMRLQEEEAQLALSKQAEQVKEYKSRARELEEELKLEQDRQAEDQEARTRVRARVNELAEFVEQKEDELQELRSMLEQQDDLLDSRQVDLNDARAMVQSLEEQLRDLQAEAQETRLQEQEQHNKETRQLKSDLREAKVKLAGEKESNRQLESRIQILLESHQESSQINESKVQQLEQELNKRTLQLSQSSSSSSSATTTIHQLQVQVQDQERILLEKEDRIQELEQELQLAQQQAQSVIADLEQDLMELEGDRTKLETLLQKAHHQADEEQMKAKGLEIQMGQKDQELDHELNRVQEQGRLLLERLLNDIETTQVSEDPDDQQNSRFNNDSDRSIDPSVHYVYSRLQEKIRELKQECLYQDRALAEMRQQLGQCDVHIEAQQEQLARMGDERTALEERVSHLNEDLATAENNQQQLRKQLQRRDSQLNSSLARRTREEQSSLSSSRQRRQSHDQDAESIKALQSKVRSLEDQISTLEQEKQQLLDQVALTRDQIQTMDEMIQDQTEAAKSIRAKYTDKIEALQREVVKHRKMVVKQEGQLFLYLSVIEKLKLQLRGTKVE